MPHTPCLLCRVDAMRALIKAGAEVDNAADDGVTALQECFIHPPSRTRSEAAKRVCFQQLAAVGADLNAVVPPKQYTGGQAGFVAVWGGTRRLVTMLHAAPACVSVAHRLATAAIY